MRLILSAALHLCVLVLLAVLDFAPPPTAPHPKSAHVTLAAPARPLPPPPPRRMKPVAPPPSVRTTRAFVAPLSSTPAPPPRAVAIESTLSSIAIEAPPPRTAPITSAPSLPPAPIVLGKLSDASATPPTAAPSASVRASGFGTAAPSDPPPSRPAIAPSGFSNASTTTPTASSLKPEPPVPPPAPLTPVEILSKPKPVYSTEARELRIEGDVALEVLFSASGEARVLRIIASLGHGLDEAARASATQIRFRPAHRAGSPVDQVATVRIVFRLAY